MMFLLEFAVILWMLTGLTCILLPKMPGAAMIFAGAMAYGYLTDFATFPKWTIITLLVLTVVAEIGGRLLRYHLTRRLPFSPAFGANTTVGNVGGIIVSDAILGMAGLFLWQLAVGKNLFPRWNVISQILLRASAATLMKFICGWVMILIFFFSVIL